MSKKSRTGSITSASGKISARKINTGIMIEGVADDKVLNAALKTMNQLNTGNIEGVLGVEVSDEINVGFHYLNIKNPDRKSFIDELESLREILTSAQEEPNTSIETNPAIESLDETIIEAKKEKPLGKRVINRLRETLEFITEAGETLDIATQAGSVIAKAIPLTIALYKIAQKLF